MRTVLPLPLIGHFDTYETKWIKLEATELPVEAFAALTEKIGELNDYPSGYEGEFHYDGGFTKFSVSGRTVRELVVSIEADANPALLHQLIEKLQASSDEITITGPTWGVTEALAEAGFYPDARKPEFIREAADAMVKALDDADVADAPSVTVMATNAPPLVWFKPRPPFLAS